MNQTWENGKKPSFGPNFCSFDTNSGRQIFFSKFWLRQTLDIIASYHLAQYQKKLMIQSWENLVTDRRTDGRTDWQTDECDFTGRCPTNIERPTSRLDSLIQIICLTVVLRTRKICSEECYRRIKRNFSRKHRGSFI